MGTGQRPYAYPMCTLLILLLLYYYYIYYYYIIILLYYIILRAYVYAVQVRSCLRIEYVYIH